MKHYVKFLLLALSLTPPSWGDAQSLQDKLADWQASNKKWADQYQLANPEQKQSLIRTQPDPADYVIPIWNSIGKNLKQDYALPGVIWLIQNNQSIARAYLKRNPNADESAIESAMTNAKNMFLRCVSVLENQFLLYPGVGKVSGVLGSSADPRFRELLNKIRTLNSYPEDQGLASLGLALSYGVEDGLHRDDPGVVSMRAMLLKEAIMKAYDSEINGVPTKKVLEDLLYEINNLTKGRPAPKVELVSTATDTNVALPLPGKNTLLLFWEPDQLNSVKILSSLEQIKSSYPDLVILPISTSAKGVVVDIMKNIGVEFPCLLDNEAKAIKAYQVNKVPYVYMISKDGKIVTRGEPGAFFSSSLDGVLATMKNSTKSPSGQKTTNESSVPKNLEFVPASPQGATQGKPSPSSNNTPKPTNLPGVPELPEIPDELKAPTLGEFPE